MSDHHAHLKRMAIQAANEDEDALLWALAEIERLRELILDACGVFEHYDLPEHAFHYRRALEGNQRDSASISATTKSA